MYKKNRQVSNSQVNESKVTRVETVEQVDRGEMLYLYECVGEGAPVCPVCGGEGAHHCP